MSKSYSKRVIYSSFLLIACMLVFMGYQLRKMHQAAKADKTEMPEHSVFSGYYQTSVHSWYEKQMNEAFLLW